MSSCVLGEQNELVVRTGLDLRLRQLDTTKLNRDTHVFVVDGRDSKHFNASMCQVINHMTKAFYDSGIPSGEIHRTMPSVRLCGSILDTPKECRSKAITICFNEPSYNGRQCLYHLYGEKLGLKPYQAFIDAIEQTQKNGDAIVFTEEEVMWFPGLGPSSEHNLKKSLTTPLAELREVEAIPRGEFGQFTVDLLPPTLKGYVERHFPQTKFVNIGKVKGGTTYLIRGWNKELDAHTRCDWASQVWVEEEKPAKEPKQPLVEQSVPISHLTTHVFPSADMDFFGGKKQVPLQEVPYLVRSWIQLNKNRKEATHITAGPSVGVSGHMYWIMTGYKDGKELWRDSVIGVLPESTVDVLKRELLIETVKILDAVKTLTDSVTKLEQKMA